MAGLLFGMGLLLSGMANPTKVLGFLDLAGQWDPSLALVMVGAIGVALLPMAWARQHAVSLLGGAMQLPARRDIDRRLVGGSLIFGIGWGLAGVCPGPALVLLAGVLLAQVANGLVRGAAEGIGLEYSAGLGRITQGLVIIISISVAISQLEVKTDLLNHVIVIGLITVGLAVALAMGLGSREIAGQILAGIYVRELYQVGQQVRIGEVEGHIEEIGTVKTTLLTDDGELVSLSNRELLEQRVNSR
ncbi:DUF6691 family protein [Pseudomonas qingdaonensis]|uniref:DUF6691 family protein n=1 Tax=Pseudomonas qingdaonensis TaxID=2056231 RepID=UPI003512B5E1